MLWMVHVRIDAKIINYYVYIMSSFRHLISFQYVIVIFFGLKVDEINELFEKSALFKYKQRNKWRKFQRQNYSVKIKFLF